MNPDTDHVHILGISGKAMSALALMLRQAGYSISGSDSGVFDPIASHLKKHGIGYNTEYAAENIPPQTTIVAIGKTYKLQPDTNAEVARAEELRDAGQVQIMSMPEMIGKLVAHQDRIVVAGSYGKSTCTALLAWCLREMNYDPSYMTASLPFDLDPQGHIGGGTIAALEGDEYPTSYWDDRSKFEHFSPKYVLLTAAEHDHITVFPTIESYLERYRRLLENLPEDGVVVGCTDNPHVSELLGIASANSVVSYGTDGDYQLTNIDIAETSSTTVTFQDTPILTFETSLLGLHNLQNILGVVALLHSVDRISSPDELAAAIKSFSGIRRRLDRIGAVAGMPVYEGYGSNYTKARTAIEAIQLHFPDRPITVVFEPHTFTWQDRRSADQYATVFTGVDQVYIIPPPSIHNKTADNQMGPDEITDLVTATGMSAQRVDSAQEIYHHLGQLGPTAVILLLSSGDLGGLPAMITENS